MAIKELFYDQRPIALLDPRASQRIDPRFKYTRNSIGTYINRAGLLKIAGNSDPRFGYDPVTKEYLGLLLEKQSTNYIQNSNLAAGTWPAESAWTITASSTDVTAPDGSQFTNKGVAGSTGNLFWWRPSNNFVALKANTYYTQSVWVRTLPGVTTTITLTSFPYENEGFFVTDTWTRIATTYYTGNNTTPAYNGFLGGHNRTIYAWGWQLEESDFVTSYIPTAGSSVTRAADILSVDAVEIPASGSIYIDARAIRTNANDTLLSLKNASNQKINLAMEQRSETYNSLALINTYSGTAKSSLPLPVPTTNRERNIITWGANNYQYTKDSSRFAPSLSTSVPANLTSLSIGHDSVDPTKAFNGYINSVYLYSGEIAPAVAEALVRGELNPVNADTYSPSGPAGSLALVINTQGASASGDKVFALPAESAANDNNLVITWGDGTESALELAAAEVGAAGLSHTYPSAGIYPVWVAGKMQNLYFNNSASAPDLLSIASWGTGQMFTSPSTMNSAFYGCSKLTSIASSGLPNTSAVTDWFRAFRGCSSLTGTFPSFNFSAATTLQEAFHSCSSLTSFPAVDNQTQNVTNFASAWISCSSLASFPLINTAVGTNFASAWESCTGLTSFPLINTSAGNNFARTWFGCTGLTSFPLINTASATTLNASWFGCSGLTSFPLLNTSSVTTFSNAWLGCSSLTSFPLINTALGTNFASTWSGCTGLTSFPLINTSSGTAFGSAWYYCTSLTSFPLIDTSKGVTFDYTWTFCGALTSFPAINTNKATSITYAWFYCSSLTSFPVIDTSSCLYAGAAWGYCSSLTSFPSLNFNAVIGSASDSNETFTGFRDAWINCTSLSSFPAGRFNNTTCTRYLGAFQNCALTAASIENIIVSINAAGTSNGNLSLQGGTNAGASTWTANAVTAYNALVARGWTITRNA